MGKKKSTRERAPKTKHEHYSTVLKMLSSDSQCRRIMAHLMLNGSITQAEAIAQYNVYRLAARIADLRMAGVDIRTELQQNTHNRGHHARYVLE